MGGKAVNLSPSTTPQDVYTRVLEIVLREIEKDCAIPLAETSDAKTLSRAKSAR